MPRKKKTKKIKKTKLIKKEKTKKKSKIDLKTPEKKLVTGQEEKPVIVKIKKQATEKKELLFLKRGKPLQTAFTL